MQKIKNKILIWLPSPMGDAILCTPALKAIRKRFESSDISFFVNPVVRQILSPSTSNDRWIEQQANNPFMISRELKKHKFTHAILFKNSFASALSVFLAGIPSRIGYTREGRGIFLTEKLYPLKLPNGSFKPIPMVNYYLAIASLLGAETDNRSLELTVEPQKKEDLLIKLPELAVCRRPIIILVPGGAYGPSKYWPANRYAQTADWLTSNYKATVFVSIASNPVEREIANKICSLSKHRLINLGERPISLGELKAFYSLADLVISNDTGPRHIAIALKRKIITLFGPNNPVWTQTNYDNEIQIVGDVPCAPCNRPVCKESRHLCMEAINVEMVCKASQQLLQKENSEHL